MTWTAPTYDGGSAIIKYTVTCVHSVQDSPSVDFNNPCTGTTCTTGTDGMTGLTAGTDYVCVVTATNIVGTGRASTPSNLITTIGVPGAPINVYVASSTTSGTKATVYWTAPASNGGSAIIKYTVFCTNPFFFSQLILVSQDFYNACTGTACTTGTDKLTGLTSGAGYNCQVTASNAVGTSLPSAQSNFFATITVPTAPTIGTSSPGLNPGTGLLTWTAPASDGGSAITKYTVSCVDTQSQAVINKDFTTSPNNPCSGTRCSTGGSGLSLRSGHYYRCTVTATNVVGTGPASAQSSVFGVI